MHDCGCLVDTKCSRCGADTDSVFHRLWVCSASRAKRDATVTDKAGPAALLVKYRAAGGKMALYMDIAATRAIIPDLVGDITAPFVERGEGCLARPLDGWSGTVYTDGSCYHNREINKPRAGYGVAVISTDGTVCGRLFGAVPIHLPQSAAAGEAYAVLRARQHIGGPLRVASDNAAVVQNMANLRDAIAPNKALAGVYTKLLRLAEVATTVVRKVTGHQAALLYPAGTLAWEDAVGNTAADAAANLGTQRHTFDAVKAGVMHDLAVVAQAAVRIGAAEWDKWGSMGKFSQYLRAPAADALPRTIQPRHRWVREAGTRYRCLACARVTSSLSCRIIAGPCRGRLSPSGVSAVLRNCNGHRLVAVYVGQVHPHLACTKCGAWAAGRPIKLSAACTEHPTAAGRAALRRLEAGRSPRGEVLEAAYYIINGQVAFERSVQFRN